MRDLAYRYDSAALPLATPVLSVIMPTFRRVETLERTLRSYEAQTGATGLFELIVVDDGSLDETRNTLQSFVEKTALSVGCAGLAANAGPAVARNTALGMVRGSLILIMGDDIEISPDFLAGHLAWHQTHPAVEDAVLGYVTWPPGLNATPFMKWLEGGGRHHFFNYQDMPSGGRVAGTYFYTCNVSLKRDLLFRTELFDATFLYASQEDLELGHRLERAGMRLHFERGLAAYHWHYLTVAGIARRSYVHGYSARQFWARVPDPSSRLRKWLRSILICFGGLPVTVQMWERLTRWLRNEGRGGPMQWKTLLVLSYWVGLADAMAGRSLRDVKGSIQ